jgi:hypothetical protein
MAATAKLYELALLGDPTPAQVSEVRSNLARWAKAIGMTLGVEIDWHVGKSGFFPHKRSVSAAAVFGSAVVEKDLHRLLADGVPLLPVVSDLSRVSVETPACLRKFNCLEYGSDGGVRVATALLECAGMLPRDRRVFLSYLRKEATPVALQLFDALSARGFQVFLDTHEIAPGVDFQEALWHQLCDSDVLVMLDTPNYFSSRWTAAEFGRALAKGIAVLRVGWPDATPSARTATASRVELLKTEVDAGPGELSGGAVSRIAGQLEAVRSLSHAARWKNLTSGIRISAEKIGGSFGGLGVGRTIRVNLPPSREVVVMPALGVPNSRTLHAAAVAAGSADGAVVYDHVGMSSEWLAHLDWLGAHGCGIRWIKESEAAWKFAGWEAEK